MVDCFEKIVKKASRNGIYLKLVTNGQLIPYHINILQYLNEVTLSIDSVDDTINAKLGRGLEHYSNIENAINIISCYENIRLNINSVVTKINLNQVAMIKDMIKKFRVTQWRIFRFCPLRETALKNQLKYEITEDEFQKIKNSIQAIELNCEIQFRDYADMENRYLLITPKGKLCVSKNMQDTVIGDMLKEDLHRWFV